MRSKLFVPGVRPELFAKALASGADAISFDLEDAVPDARKDEARACVAKFVCSPEAQNSGKLLIVRCNALASPHFTADVQALAGSGIALLNLPKPDNADEVRAAIACIERAEAACATSAHMALLANIETPRALRRAAEIAGAHPRVVGLQLGLGDLFEPAGIARRDAANVHATMFTLRLAALEVGVFAIDGAFTALDDPEGFEAEASMARRLGFIGKSCVHPRQVALANKMFRPTAAERAWAQRIVDAAREAAAQGRGVFVVDGRMIDPPFLQRAERVLAAASAFPLTESE